MKSDQHSAVLGCEWDHCGRPEQQPLHNPPPSGPAAPAHLVAARGRVVACVVGDELVLWGPAGVRELPVSSRTPLRMG